jgi:sec-independent protein translocase protein TatC
VDETELPLTEHLSELRRRLFIILGSWVAGAVACWRFRDTIFGALLRPATDALGPEGGQLQAIAPTEIFFTYLKCALLAGFVVTIPIFFWQVWGFVSPFEFFTGFESDFVRSAWTMREVFGFTTRLFLAFGIAFELPVVIFFLSTAGIVTSGQLLRGTPYAVLAIFVTAAALTPPDWISQIFLGVPMVGLYLLGVGVAWLFGDRKRRAEATEEPV